MKNQHIIAKILFALLIVLLILSGCSPVNDKTPKTSISLYGLRVTQPFDQFFGQDYYKLVYDGLFSIDYEGQILPQLVEEYEYTNETTLRLKIREGVTFHDGTTLDASDCVDTLLRQSQFVRQVYHQKYFINILEVNYEDPYRFEIVLEKPDPYFLRYMTFGITKALNPNNRTEKSMPKQFNMREPGVKTFYGDIADISQIKYHNLSPISVGSGPYMISSELPLFGDSQKLLAYENYWRGKPVVDEIIGITTIEIQNIDLALKGLLNDEFDYYSLRWIQKPRDEMYAVLKGYESELSADTNLLYRAIYNQVSSLRLVLNMNKAPLDSLEVRKAVAGALNADKIIEKVAEEYDFEDNFMVRNERGLINRESPGHIEGIKPMSDQEISQLLTQAGYPDGITLSFSGPLNFPKLNEFIIEEFAKHKVFLVMDSDYNAHISMTRDIFPSSVSDYQDYLDSFITTDRPDDKKSFYQVYLDQGGTDKRLYETIVQLHNTVDEEERIRLAQEAVTIIQEEVYEIPLYNEAFLTPYDKKVLNLTLDTGISLAKEIFGITVD